MYTLRRARGTLPGLTAAVAIAVLSLAPLSHSQETRGWFIGIGISAFEMSGSGNINVFSESVDFDIERNFAYGLVTNAVESSEEEFGLGWDASQLPGTLVTFGYRHNAHFTTHMDLFNALSKTSELGGLPNPDDPGQSYLSKQSTEWNQNAVRLALDWTPFEPLPLWYFSVGLQYVSFQSRLEFRFDGQDSFGQPARHFESYEDGGSAIGALIGTGLQFRDRNNGGRGEWFINFNYAWVPYVGDFYAWDADILVGGVALEGGLRLFLGKKGGQG